MSEVQRLGLPDADNIAAAYRLRADRIADGEIRKPSKVVMLEIYPDSTGMACCYGLQADASRRETLALILAAIESLTEAAARLNSESAH